MRKMLRKWLGIEPRAVPEVMAHDVLSGTEMVLVAYRIDNGYLLRMSSGALGMSHPLTYCADESDMVEKIIAHRARTKMNLTMTATPRRNTVTGYPTTGVITSANVGVGAASAGPAYSGPITTTP